MLVASVPTKNSALAGNDMPVSVANSRITIMTDVVLRIINGMTSLSILLLFETYLYWHVKADSIV